MVQQVFHKSKEELGYQCCNFPKQSRAALEHYTGTKMGVMESRMLRMLANVPKKSGEHVLIDVRQDISLACARLNQSLVEQPRLPTILRGKTST